MSDSVPSNEEWRLIYRGMSYESASREGGRLIALAHDTGDWFQLPEKLIMLRDVMKMQREALHRLQYDRATGHLAQAQ